MHMVSTGIPLQHNGNLLGDFVNDHKELFIPFPGKMEKNQDISKNSTYFHKPITVDFCTVSTWTLVLQGSVVPSQELSDKTELKIET